MKFVALVSGGKDSVFSIAKCLAHGHELIALANLFPPPEGPQELDSFMFQSAGASAIECLADCLGVPLIRAPMSGYSGHQGLHYTPTEGDEVEDLHALLREVQRQFPTIQAVASGAVLSTYQRTRVENVSQRLNLQSLAFLWQYDQAQLLREMIDYNLEAVLVKVASAGLHPHRHLGKTLQELQPTFEKLHVQYNFHVAGEGGEYETLTLDAPFFRKRIVLDEVEVVMHSDDVYAPVGLLEIRKCHTKEKEKEVGGRWEEVSLSSSILTPACGGERLRELLMVAARGENGGDGECDSSKLTSRIGRRKQAGYLRPLPHTWRQGRQLNISGLCVPTSIVTTTNEDGGVEKAATAATTAATQMKLCLDLLQHTLHSQGLSLHDVVFVHLYLRHISTFAAVNAIYCQAPFHPSHPPSRSCVQVPFAPPPPPSSKHTPTHTHTHIEVMLDAMALAGSGGSMDEGRFQDRQVLLVKSLSGWAPLCIGPYSQANTLAHGHLALLAGQIGLEPASMSLVKDEATHTHTHRESGRELAGGTEVAHTHTHTPLETYQALYNCAAVLHSLQSSLKSVLMVVVYVNVGEDGKKEEGRGGGGGGGGGGRSGWSAASVREWVEICRLDAGYGKVVKKKEPTAAQLHTHTHTHSDKEYSDSGSESESESDEEEDLLTTFPPPIILPLGVPDLPKHAQIEFEVMGLSTAFAQQRPPGRVRREGRVKRVGGRGGGMCVCPLPLPFQPVETLGGGGGGGENGGGSGGGVSSSLSYVWEAMQLPYILSFGSLAVFLDVDGEEEEEGKDTDTHAHIHCHNFLDYHEVGAALVEQIAEALEEAKLTWHQLSHVRVFYVSEGLQEVLLREAVVGALGGKGCGCARTFVPVSCLEGEDNDEGEGSRRMVVRVQIIALDVERMRTEAWVHEIRDVHI